MVKKKKPKSGAVDLLRMADFILLDTLIFHEVLANQYPSVRSLTKIRRNYQTTLISEWDKIRTTINYKPIFKLGVQVLNVFPTSPDTEVTLAELKDQALDIVASGIYLRHDLMGRVYHELLLKSMGGYYATYYTSIPSATLLCHVLVKTPNPSWNLKETDSIEKFKVIDPACGSGTLLSSTYSGIRDKFIIQSPSPSPSELDLLHTKLMEDIIYGFDVLDYATHLTLSTLAMHNPRARFTKSRIYTLPNGIGKDGTTYLGALDYLQGQATIETKGWGGGDTAISMEEANAEAKEEEIEEPEGELQTIPLKPGSFDIVVMNPPFSRSAKPNLKFGYAPINVKTAMKKRLTKLVYDLGLQGINVAGLGAPFIVVGHKLLKKEGRIGIVIPRHILSGVSWSKIRDILWKYYEIEYIFSNFDPGDGGKTVGGWSWSENTDLGEVMIVARKTDKPMDKKVTTFVNIMKEPRNEVESLLMSQMTVKEFQTATGLLTSNSWSELKFDNEHIGYFYRVKQQDLKVNWHIPCTFAHPEINRLSMEVMNLPNLISLRSALESYGTDIANVKTHFSPSTNPTTFPILYGHQKTMNKMSIGSSFIGYGTPKKGQKTHILHNKLASTLMLADRPHLNSEALLALDLPTPALSTAFWELTLKDPAIKPLILLWMNSTFGFLIGFGCGANSMGPIFKIKAGHLEDIQIPDPNNIDMAKVNQFYQSMKTKIFARYAEEFTLASRGQGIRKKIDDFFIRELGLSINLANYYGLIANEPAINGKGGVALIADFDEDDDAHESEVDESS